MFGFQLKSSRFCFIGFLKVHDYSIKQYAEDVVVDNFKLGWSTIIWLSINDHKILGTSGE